VTVLAHNAAILRVPFDPDRLFSAPEGDDYLVWLDELVDRVHVTRQKERDATP